MELGLIKALSAISPQALAVALPMLIVIWMMFKAQAQRDTLSDEREKRRDETMAAFNTQIAKLIESHNTMVKFLEIILKSRQ